MSFLSGLSDLTKLIMKPVGNNVENKEEDVRAVRDSFEELDVFKDEEKERDYQGNTLGIITRGLDTKIKDFQQDNDLRVDGLINPKGETEKVLSKRLRDKRLSPDIIPQPKPVEIPENVLTLTRGGLRVNKNKIAEGIEKLLLAQAQGFEPPVPSKKPETLKEEKPKPVEFDATGRMIVNREEKNIPTPERKPVLPEVLKPSFDLKKAPIFKDEESRQEVLLKNLPAKFNIKDKPDLKNKKVKERIANTIKNDKIAAKTVKEHNLAIERLSNKHGVDPDIIRSIMWTENSRGDYFSVNRLADKIGVSKSQTPLNINGDLWSPLIGKKSGALNNSEENIEAGVILVKRIGDRIEEPTAAKIGSIWNYAGRELTSDFGVAIGEAFEQKPWKK